CFVAAAHAEEAPTHNQSTLLAPTVIKNDPKLDAAFLKAIREAEWEEATAALNSGANPNARDKNGWTPLMLASQKANASLVQTLLDRGANVNDANKEKQTALHLAATIGAP